MPILFTLNMVHLSSLFHQIFLSTGQTPEKGTYLCTVHLCPLVNCYFAGDRTHRALWICTRLKLKKPESECTARTRTTSRISRPRPAPPELQS